MFVQVVLFADDNRCSMTKLNRDKSSGRQADTELFAPYVLPSPVLSMMSMLQLNPGTF